MNPRNSETPEQAFSRQTRRFRELFQDEVSQRGPLGNKLASPKSVLSFAEDLMICPNEDAVKVRLQRDREAGRGVYVIAGDAVRAADIRRALAAIPFDRTDTPFCLLCEIVRARAQAAIDKHGDSWGVPGM